MASTPSSSAKEVLVDPEVEKNASGETEMTTEIKKKIKIVFEVPSSEVRQVMNFKPKPYKVDISDELIRRFPEMAATMYMMSVDTAPVAESFNRWMLERKEDFTRQLKAKGIVTREAEVDEDYDEEKDYAPSHRGRRRHRPGVMKKHQGVATKLN
nr:uncharacterized protein LOC127320874 [Lolium perenne]XP_051205915.1 uncharacterized protein LOC127320874 [Lolium perenne]